MNRLKRKLLTVGLSVVVLGGIGGKLAIDHPLPWQNAEANSGSAARENSLEMIKHTGDQRLPSKRHYGLLKRQLAAKLTALSEKPKAANL